MSAFWELQGELSVAFSAYAYNVYLFIYIYVNKYMFTLQLKASLVHLSMPLA